MNRLCAFFAVIWFFLAAATTAQNTYTCQITESELGKSYNFQHYDIEEGLSNSYIQSLFEDSKGYIWVGTSGGGLIRFDGINFTEFNSESQIGNSIVYDILEDKAGNIWICNDDRISCFDGWKFHHFRLNKKNNGDALSLTQDKNGNIWIAASTNGLLKIIPTHFLQDSTQAEYVYRKNERIFSHVIAIDQNLYLLVDGSIFSYVNNQELESLPANKQTGLIWHISKGKNNKLWIAARNGIFILNADKELKQLRLPASYNPIEINNIYEDTEGNIWFGTENGAWLYKDGTIETFNKQNGLKDNNISALIEDQRGNIWFGTYRGLTRFEGDIFTHYTEQEGLPNNVVRRIFSDSKSQLWFATNEGLVCKKKNKIITYKACNGFPANTIISICEDENGNILAGTKRKGLLLIKNDKITQYTTEDGLSSNSIWYITKDEQKNLFYLAGFQGVSIFSEGEIFPLPGKDSLKKYAVWTILQPNKDSLLICSDMGALWYTDSTLYPIKINIKQKKDKVWTAFIDSEENLWLSLANGVAKIKHDSSIYFNTSNGLLNNSVWAFTEDNNKNLWMGTNGGLVCLMPDYNKNKFNNLKHWNRYKIRQFKIEDGFKGNDCFLNSVLKDQKGQIWWGTGRMLTKYNPDEDITDTLPPVPVISDVKLFFETPDWNKILEEDSSSLHKRRFFPYPENPQLSYKQNHLDFEFVGICQRQPDKVKYQYRLIGLDETWSPKTVQHNVSYSSLEPGKYTFQMKACNKDGYWSEVKSYSFSIIPPWWKTSWFRLLLILSLLSFAFIFYKIRIGVLKKRQKVLEQIVLERTEEIRQQNEEITAQRDDISEKNEELLQQKEEIEAQRDQLEQQRDIAARQRDRIMSMHEELTDSIFYAKRIQQAILPPQSHVNKDIPDHFIFFKPKDIVSGDFYWVYHIHKPEEKINQLILAVADCTGHGVPGAFMSMLGITFLNDIVLKENITSPEKILSRLRDRIISALNQSGKSGETKDGMDMALVRFDLDTGELLFAGANNPIYIISKTKQDSLHDKSRIFEYQNVNLLETKGDSMPVSIHLIMNEFSLKKFLLQAGDEFYLFSDGFADQFGGNKGKKFMYKKLRNLLIESYNESCEKQLETIENTFSDWIQHINPSTDSRYDQIDDICLIGMKY